jgi:hypothetical protein
MSTSALTEFLLSPLFAPPQAHRRGSQLPLAVGNACPLCGERMRDGEMAAMYVVPPVHYASRVADDRVAVCLGCAQVRGVADLAELVTVAPGLLALRQRVLEGGTHHLTPWRDREAIRCELSRRSALPRVHLAAAQADDSGGACNLFEHLRWCRSRLAFAADADPCAFGAFARCGLVAHRAWRADLAGRAGR